tara:strand:+ start:208 stop:840 length:633 start_codon:yes stop_codon:yes gene_type:complete
MINHNLIVVDDFFEDPYFFRNLGISQLHQTYGEQILGNPILNDENETHPGFRVDINPELCECVVDKVCKIIDDSIRIGLIFYVASSVHKCGLIHNDTSKIAGVIYLNENPPEDSGTVLYDQIKEYSEEESDEMDTEYKKSTLTQDLNEIEKFNIFKKEYNEMHYKPDCIVQNKFNRCILYNGTRWHGAHNYFGDTIFDSRLVIAFQGDII